ncbi:MAG TPA: nucleotide exchange factor GrpE [Terriglobales bacterium]|nr:nucleotide exchange factor GrpE [Terriglobales bacterium]
MTAVKVNREDQDKALDLDHELPSGENETASVESQAASDRELSQLKSERDTLYDRLARLQAEFDNYRKRQVREQQDFRDFALAEAIKTLLPIVDSFDRALQAPEGPEFRKGVELINRQFHDALTKLGVEPLEAEGQPFDPNYHQAVQMVETDEADHNHVVDQLQRGYKLKDRLLRPAMVRVAQNSKKS